ncbi:sodium/calcium exchanger regulatory protein 1-like [Polistes fuscatus]|uniref:sodium/calcium exchanger regulatory protein 1-like n=1 Tax=Polistes fuscatus TaxID=30207 RepID=UPI001CA810BD|nr:sodium/calcium exchanger regulatory protein 1-like [Polistes fuscatus]
MAPIVGTYQHERNENIDEYFKDLGVPYIARKMMGLASPRMEISNEGEKWSIRTVSMMRTLELVFVLGEEYEETLPSGEILKNVTTMEDDSLVTVSYRPDNTKIVRKYDFNDDGLVLTMSNEKSDAVAKRYFKRIP